MTMMNQWFKKQIANVSMFSSVLWSSFCLFEFEDMHLFCVALSVSLFSLSALFFNLFRYSSFGTKGQKWSFQLSSETVKETFSFI